MRVGHQNAPVDPDFLLFPIDLMLSELLHFRPITAGETGVVSWNDISFFVSCCTFPGKLRIVNLHLQGTSLAADELLDPE